MERSKDKKLEHHIRRFIKQIVEVAGRKKKEVEIEGEGEGERKGDKEGRENAKKEIIKQQQHFLELKHMNTEIDQNCRCNETFLC